MESTVEHNPAYALVRVAGSPTISQILALIESVGVESQAWPQGAVLVDLREVTSLASFTEQYRLGEVAVWAFAHLSKLASLVPPERITRTSENVARQEGLNLRVFTSEAEAIGWLTESPASPA